MRKLFLCFFVFVFLSACNSKSFTFTGESENWSAELKVSQSEDGYENQKLKVQYNGEDVRSVGEISYKVETNAGAFEQTDAVLNDNGIFMVDESANPTNAKITEGSEVKITLEWDDNVEIITLVNK